jgi:hypothetical protein
MDKAETLRREFLAAVKRLCDATPTQWERRQQQWKEQQDVHKLLDGIYKLCTELRKEPARLRDAAIARATEQLTPKGTNDDRAAHHQRSV